MNHSRYYFLRRHKTGETEATYWYEVMVAERESLAHPSKERSVCVVHSEATGRVVCDELNAVYRHGVIVGLTRFAWWKDGEQFVGTCGTTLARAVEDFDRERF